MYGEDLRGLGGWEVSCGRGVEPPTVIGNQIVTDALDNEWLSFDENPSFLGHRVTR